MKYPACYSYLTGITCIGNGVNGWRSSPRYEPKHPKPFTGIWLHFLECQEDVKVFGGHLSGVVGKVIIDRCSVNDGLTSLNAPL